MPFEVKKCYSCYSSRRELTHLKGHEVTCRPTVGCCSCRPTIAMNDDDTNERRSAYARRLSCTWYVNVAHDTPVINLISPLRRPPPTAPRAVPTSRYGQWCKDGGVVILTTPTCISDYFKWTAIIISVNSTGL